MNNNFTSEQRSIITEYGFKRASGLDEYYLYLYGDADCELHLSLIIRVSEGDYVITGYLLDEQLSDVNYLTLTTHKLETIKPVVGLVDCVNRINNTNFVLKEEPKEEEPVEKKLWIPGIFLA